MRKAFHFHSNMKPVSIWGRYDLTKGVKDAVVARELADNVVQLHAYLYPEAAYAYHLPEEIKRISEDIAWMSDVKK